MLFFSSQILPYCSNLNLLLLILLQHVLIYSITDLKTRILENFQSFCTKHNIIFYAVFNLSFKDTTNSFINIIPWPSFFVIGRLSLFSDIHLFAIVVLLVTTCQQFIGHVVHVSDILKKRTVKNSLTSGKVSIWSLCASSLKDAFVNSVPINGVWNSEPGWHMRRESEQG